MFKDTQENLQSWSSGWQGVDTNNENDKVIYTYQAQPGSIDVIDIDVVRAIKEPLIEKANGTWNMRGMRYIYDRTHEVMGVVFSSYALEDIADIVNNKCWQAVGHATKLKSGMPVFVVPNDAVLKEKPASTGIKFRLA